MKRSVTPPPESEERRRVRGRRAAYDYDRREQEAADEMRAEPTQREASFALPAARRRCAHCGDHVTGSGYARLGPLPLPGQDSDLVPRLPADRPACRAVAGHPLPGEDE
ncbi:hypothetical protein OG321_35880 [Streptomyces sp. NBC_00424]|uniref:hypothetical protein n=1 Tax=Streptomyces sp. NBC_00424 TaxID=2903648 RepID=UPI00225B9535|nr:hypothetical protein [Streptomyces sp. NBC_00424]MCX5077838.1 hypothetical protein [Streptomyces sp. NBC_00424]